MAIKERNMLKKCKKWLEYKQMRNKVNALIRRSKKNFYNKAIKGRKESKVLWRNIRSLKNNEQKGNAGVQLPRSLHINDTDVDGVQQVLNAFNQHFTDIANTIDKTPFNESEFDQMNSILKVKLKNIFFTIAFITPLEVKTYIEQLNLSKAAGLDRIGPNILKHCGDNIVLPLTSIINNSIRTGIFPDKLKEAKVIPIFKSSDRSDPNNYRPISILPTLSKIFERHLTNQIKHFLQENNIIHKYQSGFREKHSCHTALTRIIDDWLDAIDNGMYVGALFLDLRKAFDLVDHEILLHKLKLYNFSINSIEIIRSYLTSRHQIVKIGNNESSRRLIRSGVPQGSILGPILFLIYINDLSFQIKDSMVDLYADDSTLYTKGVSLQKIEHNLQISLNKVTNWCTKNNMAINAQKTKCMVLGSSTKLRKSNEMNMYVNNVRIQNVNSHKLLGVILDESLTWNLQVDAVVKKVNSKIALLKRINYFLNEHMRILFYNAYILPVFDYCCSIWGKGTQKHQKKMTILQKRAAKIILFKPFTTPSNKLFKELDWLTFENRCKYQTAVLVYKSLHDLTPYYIRELVNLTSNDKYNLRSSSRQDIAHFHYKTQYKKKSFAFHSVTVWNFLPEHIRKCKSENIFKMCCKKFLMNYQTSSNEIHKL